MAKILISNEQDLVDAIRIREQLSPDSSLRLGLLNRAIDEYISESEERFKVICLKDTTIMPNGSSELDANIMFFLLDAAKVFLSIRGIKLSLIDSENGAIISAENHTDSEVKVSKGEVIGFGIAKNQKALVKAIRGIKI